MFTYKPNINTTRSFAFHNDYLRMDLTAEFPSYWASMKVYYDRALCCVFEASFVRKVPVINFIRSHYHQLSMFAAKDHIDHLCAVLEGQAPPKFQILRQVLGCSLIAGLLFTDLRGKMNYNSFLEDVLQQIKVAEYNDFKQEDMDNFKIVASGLSDSLNASGVGLFEKLKAPIPFLGSDLVLVLPGPLEVSTALLKARLKAIGLNTGALSLLPWEQLVLSPGSMDNVPTTITLPAGTLDSSNNCRDYCQKILGKGPLTFAQMRKEVNANLKDLLSMDRHFYLEAEFLNVHVEKLIVEKVQMLVMSALPSDTKFLKMGQVPNGVIQRIARFDSRGIG